MAETYEIYFREQGDSWVQIGEAQPGLSFVLAFGMLGYNITYEWRIDSVNEFGTTTGDTWNFDSILFYPPLPTGVTLDGSGTGDGDPSGDPTGENAVITMRRLVAVANNKVWYEDI